jgi:glycosyltransferase involved in cell wall biosynthesis
MTSASPRVLVMTTVHDPRDARVAAREITALLDAGWSVTYAAPFTDYQVPPPEGVVAIDLPVSRGRRRLRGLRAARSILRREAEHHDAIIVHSPELLIALIGIKHPCLVWDVHEDVPASMNLKPWLPAVLRRPTAWAAQQAERIAERHVHLLLAESAYQERFRTSHPIVPNSTFLPTAVKPSGTERIVYVGHLSRARGVETMIESARLLQGMVQMHLVGHADVAARELLNRAQRDGVLTWHGYLPNEQALKFVEGATAGLSLLRDEPNYRHSRPTKVYEYLARGVPVITTPLSEAVHVVEESGGGVVVPFDDPDAVVRAVHALLDNDVQRQHMAQCGRTWVETHANWSRDKETFTASLKEWMDA